MSEMRESQRRLVIQLARDIAYGVGDDRDGWYGAAEARLLADEVLRLPLYLDMEESLRDLHERLCGCEWPGRSDVCVAGGEFSSLPAQPGTDSLSERGETSRPPGDRIATGYPPLSLNEKSSPASPVSNQDSRSEDD